MTTGGCRADICAEAYAAVRRRARQRRSALLLEAQRVREARVAGPAPGRARARQQRQPAPHDPVHQLASRCRASRCGRRARAAAARRATRRQPGERSAATKRSQRAALAPRQPARAAGEQRLAPGPRAAGSRGSRRRGRRAAGAGAAPRRPARDLAEDRAGDAGRSRRAGGRRRRRRPRRAPTSPSQWSWNCRPGRVGERQRELGHLAPEERRGAGDRVGDEQRRRGRCGCCAGPATASSRSTRPSASTSRWSRVDERRAAERAAQRRELVRVPAVVLVAQRDAARPRRAPAPARARSCGRSRSRRSGARDARSARRPRAPRSSVAEALRARAVVADHADPAPVGLRAQRLDLGARTAPGRARRSPCRPRRSLARGSGLGAAAARTGTAPTRTAAPAPARTPSSTRAPSGRGGTGTVAHQPPRSPRSGRGMPRAATRCGVPSTSTTSRRAPVLRHAVPLPYRSRAVARSGAQRLGQRALEARSAAVATAAGR